MKTLQYLHIFLFFHYLIFLNEVQPGEIEDVLHELIHF